MEPKQITLTKKTAFIYGLVVLFFLFFQNYVVAQNNIESWSLPIDETTQWISVDKQTHTVFYYNGSAIKAYDYQSKSHSWEVDAHDFEGAKYEYDEKNPYLILSDEKFMSFSDKQKKLAIIDRMAGELVFDSHDSQVFDESQVHFSLEHNYALLMKKEKIKRDKKKGIEKQINQYLSLIRIGEQKALWTIQIPNEEAYGGLPNFLNSTYDFDYGPVGNEEVIAFSYGKYLYAINVADGSVKWKRDLKELDIKFLRKAPSTHQNQGFLVGHKLNDDRHYSLNFISFETGEPLWDKPFDLGSFYNIAYGPEWILVKSSYGFNYVNYNGELRWKEYIKPEGVIHKVYQQQNGYLITVKKDDQYYFNWYDLNQEPAFDHLMPLQNSYLREGVNLDGYIVLVTARNINTYDTQLARQIASIPLSYYHKFSINRKNKSVVFTDDGVTGYILKNRSETEEMIAPKKFFTERKDTIHRIETWPNKNVFLSDNEMVQFDDNGNPLGRIYYKQPSDWLAKGLIISAVVLGTIYAEEIYMANISAYNEGLIDSETFQNNLDMMGRDDLGRVQKIGVGGFTAKLTAGVIDGVTTEKPYNPFERVRRLWFYRDKLENGQWGLRVVDLVNAEEVEDIAFGKKKDFEYQIDELGGILMNISDEQMEFYDLAAFN